jgi:hypothetical protein
MKALLLIPLSLLALASCRGDVEGNASSTAKSAATNVDPELFVFVTVQAASNTSDRYEGLLGSVLQERGFGHVTGSFLRLGDQLPGGSWSFQRYGFDIAVTDRSSALKLVREQLILLGVPTGSEIHYTAGGHRLRDVLAESGWTIGVPRTYVHPHLGV